MDTTKTITHLGLCAGYGGIELGLKRIIPNLRSVALCEIEAFACANLVSKMEAGLMEPAPIWTDLKTFPWAEFRDRVDILTGGYPCQPFSAAGKRLGTEDPRHLWPWIADGIRLLRPRLCFFENVEGHISLGLREVIGELEQIGYQTAFGIFSAREVGAPHQRKRVFIMAHLKCEGLERLYKWHTPSEQTESFGADSGSGCQRSAWEGCELADDTGERLSLSYGQRNEPEGQRDAEFECCGHNAWPSRPGEAQHGWEPPRVVAGRKIMDDTQERCLRIDGENQRAPDGDGNTPNITSHGGGAGAEEAMGNAAEQGCQRSGRTNDPRWTIDRPTESNGGCAYGAMEPKQRQAEPALGGNPDGTSDRMDYAELQDADSAMRGDNAGTVDGAMEDSNELRLEKHRLLNTGLPERPSGGQDAEAEYARLCISCDNRTDELRLLGNGVVPATAERAFRILIEELFKQQKE